METHHQLWPFRIQDTNTAATAAQIWPVPDRQASAFATLSHNLNSQPYQQNFDFNVQNYRYAASQHASANTTTTPDQCGHPSHHDLRQLSHPPLVQRNSNIAHHDSPSISFHGHQSMLPLSCSPYAAPTLFTTAGQSYQISPLSGGLSAMQPSPFQPSKSLPLPSSILPSQDSPTGPCLACRKRNCPLTSHRHFTKYMLDNVPAKRKKGTSDTESGLTDENTPRPSTAIQMRTPVLRTGLLNNLHIPIHEMPALDAERQHLLSLWHEPWSFQHIGGSKSRGRSQLRMLERHLFPKPFLDRVLTRAYDHPPLLHALLTYSVAAVSLSTHDPALTALCTRQQNFAVELLSQACPSEIEAGTDPAMLAATLLMLVYMAQGNGFEVQKHVSGLMHLCRSRGGLHYLGMEGIVAECLLRADAMQAVWTNVAPVWHLPLPPLKLDVKIPVKFGQGLQSAVVDTRSIHEAQGYGMMGGPVGSGIGISMDILMAFHSMCRAAEIVDLVLEGNGGVGGPEKLPQGALHGFGYLSGIAEYQLARCNTTYHGSGTIDECVCLALLLLNYVVLRNEGPVTPLLIQIEYRFWTALNTCDSRGQLEGVSAELGLWMCLTACSLGILLSAQNERSQFHSAGLQALRSFNARAGIGTWEEVKRDVLDEYVWIAAAQEELFHSMWLESNAVEAAKVRTKDLTQKGNMRPPGG